MNIKLTPKRYTLTAVPRGGFTQPQSAGAGFTLLESLLAMSLFAIMTIVILDVFTQTQSIQARASSLQKLQDDGRFIMNKLASDIRNGSILYECYESQVPGVCDAPINSVNGNTVLAIKDREGASVIVKQGTLVSQCGDSKNTPCLLISRDYGATFSRMSQGGGKIVSFQVFLFPDKDPFAFAADGIQYQSNDQPRVRIVFTEKTTVTRKKEEATITLQTLVSTREYKR